MSDSAPETIALDADATAQTPKSSLSAIAAELRQAVSLQGKRDIQMAARQLGHQALHPHTQAPIDLGDDCAAIPQADGHLLLAAEGLWPQLVESEPWFAGWCAVMVNVSDIYAMGGTPLAIVDTLWAESIQEGQALWAGMKAASLAYGVPIVGGHTNCRSDYTALSVAILGESQHLLSSFEAQPGDRLLMAVDLRGQRFKNYPFWNAATTVTPQRLREDLAVLPRLAARGWCRAGKDISMGG
ncbi:MAG: AIR synthase related protein, partial [Elainellaceae cyanobacterium]